MIATTPYYAVIFTSLRTEGDKGQRALSEFVARVKKEVETRALSGS